VLVDFRVGVAKVGLVVAALVDDDDAMLVRFITEMAH
jgi:hypothetical protein